MKKVAGRKLTHRGFIAAAGLLPVAPAPPRTAYTTREVTIWKGRSVGATTGVLENVVRFVINGIDYEKDDPLPPPFGRG